jgi:magnesium-transporting ATPase (P-type)
MPDESVNIYCKGAPEIVINHCDMMIGVDGKLKKISQQDKDRILETVVKEFANKSYRTILVAQKSYVRSEWEILN